MAGATGQTIKQGGNFMKRSLGKIFGFVLLVLWLWATLAVAAGDKPAIVLTAFGTSTAAFDTYKYFEEQVKKRFPDYEIRWAYTSKIVRKKLKEEQQRDLPDLPQVLQDLKAQGFKKAVVQSLHIVPGEEWQKKVVAQAKGSGLQVGLGQPLLASPEDHRRVLAALAKDIPVDHGQEGVILVGHGSPVPSGEREYQLFNRLLRNKYKNQPVYFGVIEGRPEIKVALAAIKKARVEKVTLIPFLLVAGDHFENDIMGEKDSLKAELQTDKPREVRGIDRGLGYNDGVIQVYLDHLTAALKQLEKS